jgi:hypothetical protein
MLPLHLRRAKPADPPPPPRRPQRGGGLVAFALIAGTLSLGLAAVYAGRDRIPPRWNPWAPLDLAEAPTLFTGMKLDRAAADPDLCFAALARAGAAVTRLPDLAESPGCGIAAHAELAHLSWADIGPVNTACGTALRLYGWERHVLQPAALAHLGEQAFAIEHAGSYACRVRRTGLPDETRPSAHAEARAIDITAVRLAGGERLTLKAGWQGSDREAAFWQALRDGACDWFPTVLSPDYNDLHADHFHLGDESRICR